MRIFVLVTVLLCIFSLSCAKDKDRTVERVLLQTPSFCVDPEVLAIFEPRLKCITNSDINSSNSIAEALKALPPSTFQRAQELLAFSWFVIELLFVGSSSSVFNRLLLYIV
tara:strand:+ start:225 stop:557 length:333 start_codon:yes stop_codon:yes gene_type:complete